VDQHVDAYDPLVTELCERALVTVIGNAGFWGRHLYLVGGLAGRYLTQVAPPGAPAHVGSRDVDLALVLAVEESAGGSYETLMKNLRDGGFRQAPEPEDPEYRWRRNVDGHPVVLEFLGETDDVEPGRMFRPRGGSGSSFQALNVRGVRLLPLDYSLVKVAAVRLDDGGRSEVSVRVTGLFSFVVLKVFAYQDRHHAKDAYDLIHVLQYQPGGAAASGGLLAGSPVGADDLAIEAFRMLAEHFGDPGMDGPTDYGRFMDATGDPEVAARYRNEAVAVVDAVLRAYRGV